MTSAVIFFLCAAFQEILDATQNETKDTVKRGRFHLLFRKNQNETIIIRKAALVLQISIDELFMLLLCSNTSKDFF